MTIIKAQDCEPHECSECGKIRFHVPNCRCFLFGELDRACVEATEDRLHGDYRASML